MTLLLLGQFLPQGFDLIGGTNNFARRKKVAVDSGLIVAFAIIIIIFFTGSPHERGIGSPSQATPLYVGAHDNLKARFRRQLSLTQHA